MSLRRAIPMFVVVLTLAVPALAGEWGYEGEHGPEHWADLDPANAMCRLGKNQSPIDLNGFVDAKLPDLKIGYLAGASEFVNNGHTLQINYAAGSTLIVDGRTFELQQMHFHSPSENHIRGKSYPLEAHLVHKDKDGDLAVIAVMFEEGSANAELAKFWVKVPAEEGDKVAFPAGMSVAGLLPRKHEYYRFSGSLTTPPCSEGVRWIVMKTPVTVSKEQVATFAKALGFANNRPIQPVNAREILE